jgi:hypothetical protein
MAQAAQPNIQTSGDALGDITQGFEAINQQVDIYQNMPPANLQLQQIQAQLQDLQQVQAQILLRIQNIDDRLAQA